jgi:hypothetical protein
LLTLQIMIIVFGQQLPDADAGLPSQLFGVAAASTGLASFALVLALVEQVCQCCTRCANLLAANVLGALDCTCWQTTA